METDSGSQTSITSELPYPSLSIRHRSRSSCVNVSPDLPLSTPLPPQRPLTTNAPSFFSVLLTYRCYSFINSLHGGATMLRRVLGVLVTLLAFASFASGITSTHALLSYSDFGALAQDSVQGATLFEVTQGLWIGLSLFVDVILSVGVSLELLSALVRF